MSALATWSLALRLARRELRGGVQGFAVLLACLALGVAAIAAVGIVNAAVTGAIERDARALLGGDLTIQNPGQPLPAEELARLVPADARLASTVRTTSIASAGERRVPVVIKAVDDAYPLLGEVVLEPPLPLALALAEGGVVAEPALAARLQIAVGETFTVGDARLTLRAILLREPDRVGGFVGIGPRVIMGQDALAASGVLRPGAVVDHEYGILLPAGRDAVALAAALQRDHPDASWRVRSFAEVQPGLARTTDRLATYLTLAGLTALLVGGLGIGLTVQTYLAGKVTTIATLKCLGAESRQIVAVYLAQILALAGAGTILGLIVGQLLPLLLVQLPEALLPIDVVMGLYPQPLALAAAAGMLTALAFALWPLGMAREVSPAGLFRALVEPLRRRPRPGFLLALAGCVLALAALATVGVARPEIGLVFVAVALASALALALVATALLRAIGRLGERGPLPFRLAIRNLRRPSAGAASVTVALGAGLAVLICVVLLEANLQREITGSLPQRTPSVVFIDIQPDQWARFQAIVAAESGARMLDSAPHLRARIVRLGEVAAHAAEVDENVRWTLRRDRGLTYSRLPPDRAELVAGSWWPADHAGPPLVSIEAEIARGYGLGVGDTIAFNILGRVVEARIANLRQEIAWTSGRLEFIFILSPGVIEGAPHTMVATVAAPGAVEPALIDKVARELPNVTPISIGSIVTQLGESLDRIGTAVRIVAGVTLATGVLVLAGAVGAARRRHQHQTVILKVLGAPRRDILGALTAEYLVLGLAAAVVGLTLGTAGAWILTTQVFDLGWAFAASGAAIVTVGALALVIAIGAVATWRLLGASAASVLRTP